MSLEQQVADLTARIAALETQLKEIKELKGIPGPRGGAGDISAAVTNAASKAEAVVRDAESRVQSRADARYETFAANLKTLQEEMKQFLEDGFKIAAENHCIQVLRDYHLLNEKYEPTHWKSETPQQAKD